MTTEEDFQKALDAKPEDYQTRLVFADWLQERGDPRGEGYRALGRLALWTCCRYSGTPRRACPHEETYWWRDDGEEHMLPETELPADWFDLLPEEATSGLRSKEFDSRRHADDAAALGFAKLPASRRAELLAREPVGAGT